MFLRSQKTSDEYQEAVHTSRSAESVLGDGSLAQRSKAGGSRPAEIILEDENLAQENTGETRVAASKGLQFSSREGTGGSRNTTVNPVSLNPVYSSQQPVVNPVETASSSFGQWANLPNNCLRPEELSSMLPTFSGQYQEDVNHFLKTLANTKQALNLNDQTMKMVLFKLLKGKAQHWLHSNADFMLKSYDELTTNLQAMFTININAYQLRNQLARRTWSGQESFEEYYQAKLSLAQKLNLPEKEFIEYLVEGIEDQVFRNQARIQNFKFVHEMVQAFRLIRFDPMPVRRKVNLCFSCNQPGHFAANCRAERGTDFNRLQYRNPERKFGAPKQKPNDRTVYVVEDNNDEQVSCNGLVKFRLINSNTNLRALFDTGSPISLIRRGLIISNEIKRINNCSNFRGIGGKRLKILGLFTSKILIQNLIFSIDFYVVPDNVLSLIDAIIGRDVIMQPNIRTIIENDIKYIL